MRKKYTNSFLHRKLTFLLFFLVLMNLACVGQKIDSLGRLLPVVGGLQRVDVLFALAYEYVDVDNELGLEYASKSLHLSRALGDSLRIVKSGRIKALAFRRLGNLDSSMFISKELLPVAKRNNFLSEIDYILHGIATIFLLKAQYDKSLEYEFQSLHFRKKYGRKIDIKTTLNNIGLTYYKLKDYEKALYYYKMSYEMDSDDEREFDIESLMLNISLCYTYMKDFPTARIFLGRLLDTCIDNCSDVVISKAEFNLGVISFLNKDFRVAEGHFLRSYHLSKRLHSHRLLLDNIVYLAEIYVDGGQLTFAENYLLEAEGLVSGGTPYNLELIKIYYELCNLYRNSNDFQKVAQYQQKYIQLKDSIYSEELTRNLMRVEGEYLERENTAKINAQNEILTLNEAIIFRQQLVTIFVGIAAVLLVALTIVLYKHNQRRRLANQLLEIRVRERTRELEQNRDSLQHTLDERSVVFRKISMEFRAALATVKGLCSLGLADQASENQRQYLRKIDLTSDELSRILTNTLSNSRYSRIEH